MSDYGQTALTIVGYAVGAYFNNPQLGGLIGGLAGQALFPTKLPQLVGPRLTDHKFTMSRIGQALEEVSGTDVVPGNVMWLGPVVEVAHTEEVGGKGGPEQTSTTFEYYQSIALGLCRGPMGRLIRIWENGELVYDARGWDGEEDIDLYNARLAQSFVYAQTFVVYFGGESQLPDPTIEEHKGVGNVPAFRGLMYIVYPDRHFQRDQGLRHPNFKFEISEFLDLTSRPYPINTIEELVSTGTAERERIVPFPEDYLSALGELISGTLRDVLLAYPYYEPEFLSALGELISGTLRDVLLSYPYYAPEFLSAFGELVSGTLRDALISYSNYEPEFISSQGTLVSGTLT